LTNGLEILYIGPTMYFTMTVYNDDGTVQSKKDYVATVVNTPGELSALLNKAESEPAVFFNKAADAMLTMQPE